MHWCVHVSMLTLNLPTLWALYLPIGIIINLVPYGAASGNRQLRQHREIVAAVLRQLVCDLCGDSGGAQQHCLLCGVSPYGAGDPGCNLLVVVSINGPDGGSANSIQASPKAELTVVSLVR